MSTVKMMPDSTQADDKGHKKRTKSADGKKNKKVKKDQKKKKSSKNDDLSHSDDDSDLDLSKPLHPIGSYVKDLNEMLEHMFHSISAYKLRTMLPDILKEIPVEELKKLCLEQLEVMSRKRILGVLDGIDPDNISSSTENESSDEEHKENKRDKEAEVVSHVADSTSHHSHEQTTQNYAENTNNMTEKAGDDQATAPENRQFELSGTHPLDDTALALKYQEDEEVVMEETSGVQNWSQDEAEECVEFEDERYLESVDPATLEEGEIIEGMIAETEHTPEDEDIAQAREIEVQETVAKQPVTTEQPAQSKGSIGFTKTQLEILELEMRARAIKSMLKAHTKAPK